MPIFLGGNVLTLIVEADDAQADYHSRMLKQFPGNTTLRARTVIEAISMRLKVGGHGQEVTHIDRVTNMFKVDWMEIARYHRRNRVSG